MSDVISMLDRTTSAVETLLADFDMELLVGGKRQCRSCARR